VATVGSWDLLARDDASEPLRRVVASARRAARPRVGRALLLLIAAVLFVAGWLVGEMVRGAVWCAAAVRVGFVEARKTQGRRGSAR